MKVTHLGHAGLFIETAHGSVLCDPWFSPAYFASWFPFPSNEGLALATISNPTYVYISHVHHDHFDPVFLQERVSKEATVVLPDYPLNLLERDLRALGFTKFIQTRNCVPVEVDGLRFMIMAVAGPDGDGDSTLMLSDGETRIINQNDSRPVDLETLNSFGPFDMHFVQYSGAIWYPMVYKFPPKMKQALGRKKRENEMVRAIRYAKQVRATYVVPSSGPPCFLDGELFEFNDFDRDPTNIFPDQMVFLELMRSQGLHNGRLMIPGTVADISKGKCEISHPLPTEELRSLFLNKRGYLEEYRARKRPLIDEIKASWPRGQVDIVVSLRDWIEPLLQQANTMCVGVNGRVLFDCGTQAVVIDFQQRRVYEWRGEEWEYRFRIDPGLMEYCILNRIEDWENEIFLSCRFEAERKGPYNEYVYKFFKCLSEERVQYAEGFYAERSQVEQFFECDGYRVQRRCPHQKADLTRFGEVENGILTCTLHGWQFDLATGRCFNSEDRRLYTEPIGEEAGAAAGPSPLAGRRTAS